MSTIKDSTNTPSPPSSLAHPFAIAFIIAIVLAPLFDLWQRYNKKVPSSAAAIVKMFVDRKPRRRRKRVRKL
jgi:hypothetical protein